jgi:hypothetical protein
VPGQALAAVASKCDATARRDLICKVAYLRAARRNFRPGRELEDWLGAEREVDEALIRGGLLASPPPSSALDA